MKKFFGKFVIGLSHLINSIFSLIISILSFIVDIFNGIFSLFKFIFIIGLLLGSFLMIPIILILLFNPVFWTMIFVFIVVPFLGKKFISYLRYLNYSICEYLNNYGNYLQGNTKYTSFKEFSTEYARLKEEAERKAREERQRQSESEWQERFKNFNSQFYFYGQQGGYQQGYQNYGQNSYNPYSDFKEKFEKSCRELEFDKFDVDFYEVKLQYRKLAKKYHPDLNPNQDTTEKFQVINSAFEFLTEENIKRYKQMK